MVRRGELHKGERENGREQGGGKEVKSEKLSWGLGRESESVREEKRKGNKSGEGESKGGKLGK